MASKRGKNGEGSTLSEPIPEHVSVEVSVDEFRCPKTGHVVPLAQVPTGTPVTGKYTLFDERGKTVGQGRIEDLVLAPVDAGTADAQANSEEA